MDSTKNLAHEAALVRTMVTLGINYEMASAMANKIYDYLRIFDCSDRYERLLSKLGLRPCQERLEALCMKEHLDFINFAVCFLGLDISSAVAEKRGVNVVKGNFVIKGIEQKREFLSNGQPVSYIKYPEAPWDEVKQDLRKAKHLNSLLALDGEDTRKDSDSSVIVIRAHDKQTALDAAAYAAAKIRSACEEIWEDITCIDIEDEEIEKEGNKSFDFSKYLPILTKSDIDTYYPEENNQLFAFGGFQGVQNGGRRTPYYDAAPTCPLCILIDTGRFDKEFFKKLEQLDLHSRIIYLVVNRDNNSFGFSASLFDDDKLDISDHSDEITSELEFIYALDAINVAKPKVTDGYFEALLEDAAMECERSINYKEDFTPAKILEGINDYRGEMNYKTIKRVVANAAVRKKQEGALEVSDFAFMKKAKVIKSGEKGGLSPLEKIDKLLIGQDKAKKQILHSTTALKLNAERVKAGLPSSALHNIFFYTGAPGTAKTTMAKLHAQLLQEEKLLEGDRYISVSGAQLKAPYLGQTAHKIHSLFEEHDILFIDEAYSIAPDARTDDTYAHEALAQLCVELEENCGKKLVIFAGYGGDVNEKDNKMKEFLTRNPGISSRISHTINFESYNPITEMPLIFSRLAKNIGYELVDGTLRAAVDFFSSRAHCSDFGNGREARRLLEHAIKFQSVRLYDAGKYTLENMKLLSTEDVSLAAEELLRGFETIEGQTARKIGFGV